MIGVQVTSRTKLYFQLEEDTFPNKGGYFCKVSRDDEGNYPFSEFCIQKQRLIGASGADRVRLANRIAVSRIKEIYNGNY